MKESQRLYEVLDTLPVYVVLLSEDHHVSFANRFFRGRFGESHGRCCYEYLFNRTEPCENCETYKVMKTWAPHRWEWTGPDGRNYDIYDYPFTDVDGSRLILEMGIDITDQKIAQAELEKARASLEQKVEERTADLNRSAQAIRQTSERLEIERRNLETIFDVVNVGMLLIDSNGAVKRINNTVKRWAERDFTAKLGGQVGDVLGCVHALNEPEGCGNTEYCRSCKMRKAFETVLESGEPLHGIEAEASLMQNGQQNRLWLDISIDPLVIDRQRYAIMAITNVTERKMTERALRESEERFKILADAMPHVVWSTDAAGDITYLNPRAFEYGGMRPGDIKGWRWESVVHSEDLNNTMVAWRISMNTGEPYVIEHRLRRGDGKFRWHLTRGIALRDERGIVKRWVGATTDIHDQKLAEEVLRRDNRMLEHLVENKTREALALREEAEKAKRLSDIGMLAATVAHELRNPLASIRLAVYNIQGKVPGPLIEKHLANIDKKVTESDQIINNLLFYSKIQASHPKNVNIYNIIKASVEEAAKKDIDQSSPVTVAIEPIKDLTIDADPLQIKEVFVNLLNNALDAVDEEKGRIEVNAKIDNEFLSISVKDNGIGIEEADLKKVFEPFFTTKAKGTGLGLAVCKQIMMLQGGSINISSSKGEGTAVTVSLSVGRKKPPVYPA